MISSYVPPINHFIYYSAVGIAFSLLLFRYLVPEEEQPQPNSPIKESKKGFQLPDKNLAMLGLLAFFAMVAEGTMTDWSSEYMKHITQAPIQLVGYGLTAYMFAMASGRFISDFTVRRFGEQKTLLICGILLFIGLGSSVLFPSVYSTIIAFMIVGLGVSAVVPMCYNLAGHSKSMAPQQALTLVTSIGFIGFFLGPPVIGFIAQHSSLKTAFAIIALFGLAISILSRFIIIVPKQVKNS
jgi:MFS family permease